ncbi:unnamed protein product [Ceutorhynchus assimilis]|uniref:Serine/threonine-protein phosphatase 4 regulatory subunit 1 n=1 Tax=Ceutorhynchus assimilis TaxID=467358 RepID=A0A9P0DGN2_9CUCU|nr:unnamed protein product [Ceutorhynchus assimilis]
MAGAAEISQSQSYDDCLDDLTDEGFEQGDCASTTRTLPEDASLSPLLRIQKYAHSGDIFDRHWVPRVVKDIFRTAPADILTWQLPDIMKVLSKHEDEALLKTDLLEDIPNIAAQALENSERVPALKDVIGEYLIPLVLRNIGCSDAGVDKTAQTTLVQLIQRGYVTQTQAEIKICPSILALTKMESQHQLDVNTGAIMLPRYLVLCQDEIWGVRKSCAEVIMYVSCACDPSLRRSLLAPAFAQLLTDDCRWVMMSAYQMLGAFIVTFADPPLTSIGYNASGELVMFNMNGNEFQPGGVDGFSNPGAYHKAVNFSDLMCDGNEVTDLDDEQSKKANSTSKTEQQERHEDDLLSYNEYNYWHISPGQVDGLDVSEVQENLDESASEDIVTNHLEELYATISLDDSVNVAAEEKKKTEESEIEPDAASGDTKGDNLDNKSNNVADNIEETSTPTIEEVKEPPQKIVPQELIDNFVSMATWENIYDGMSYHCAYCLPAVVLTLGKDNWPLLKNTVDALAGHMSYKIRRTVASSLHEIALILGPEIATEDLAPLFEGFLKDLDEVRIGVLNNLFEFLKLMSPEKRAIFLPNLGQFLRKDDVCNWRFQEKFAEQLTLCVQLFSTADVVKHIGLYAQALMLYNVAAVRQAAMILVTEIAKQIFTEHALASSYLSVIAERFAHSKKWKPRQTFALLCIELLRNEAMDSEEFASALLPHLLDLSWDPVANVRLVVANCIVNHILRKEYFQDPENNHIELLNKVLRRLQSDGDRDVRMLAQ